MTSCARDLLPYDFDLAVDLRKHADTREVLRHVPARFLAGYDYMGQFTFLDIALEWEGDKNLHRKRSHVTDDLINLVEAMGTAAAEERNPPRARRPGRRGAARLPRGRCARIVCQAGGGSASRASVT